MNHDWDRHKIVVLSKSDKSYKASIDDPIVELVTAINSSDDFFTTSSCSGRIMLINEGNELKRKNGSTFTYVSHALVDTRRAAELMSMCIGLVGHVFLKLEPLIIHIECRSMEFAVCLLHRLKRENEFKHSSIVSATNRKFIVCVKAMVKLEVPVVYDGVAIIESPLLERYIDIANLRMQENFVAIDKLTSLVHNGFLGGGSFSKLSSPIMNIENQAPKLVPVDPADFEMLQGVPTESFLPTRDEQGFLVARSGLRLSDDLKTVHMGEEVFGTIPERLGNRPSASVKTKILSTSNGNLLIMTDSELWMLVRYLKKGNHKFKWQRLGCFSEFENVFSWLDHDICYFSVDRPDGGRDTYRIVWQ